MQSDENLFSWAASMHYPFLVLDEKQGFFVRHGEQAWQKFTSDTRSPKSKRLAWQRIERWNSLLAREAAEKGHTA